ncbi:hypothetical protein TSMEX_009920 [Taenia solium]|eukprot:TsM_000301800 transcript=TsM_000301800 gene=TsM_000301800
MCPNLRFRPTGEGTPTATGWFEVEVSGIGLVFSKKVPHLLRPETLRTATDLSIAKQNWTRLPTLLKRPWDCSFNKNPVASHLLL